MYDVCCTGRYITPPRARVSCSLVNDFYGPVSIYEYTYSSTRSLPKFVYTRTSYILVHYNNAYVLLIITTKIFFYVILFFYFLPDPRASVTAWSLQAGIYYINIFPRIFPLVSRSFVRLFSALNTRAI